jgi:hypothetical protein
MKYKGQFHEELVCIQSISEVSQEKYVRRFQCKSREKKILSNQLSGMRTYIKSVMIMGLKQKMLPCQKI